MAARELEVVGSDPQEAVCSGMKRPAAYVLTQSHFHPGNSGHLGLGLDQTPSDQPHTHAHRVGTQPVITHFTAETVPLCHDDDTSVSQLCGDTLSIWHRCMTKSLLIPQLVTLDSLLHIRTLFLDSVSINLRRKHQSQCPEEQLAWPQRIQLRNFSPRLHLDSGGCESCGHWLPTRDNFFSRNS